MRLAPGKRACTGVNRLRRWGSAVTIACQTCGNQSPAGATVCHYCGAALQAPIAAPPQWSPPVVQPPALRPGAWAEGGPVAYHPAYQPRALLPPKDPSTGLVLELLPGLFGFLGIGRLWAGDVGIGIALLFGYWVFWALLGFFIVIMSIFTLGIAFCIVPAVWIGVPVVSGLILRDKLARLQAQAVGLPRVR